MASMLNSLNDSVQFNVISFVLASSSCNFLTGKGYIPALLMQNRTKKLVFDASKCSSKGIVKFGSERTGAGSNLMFDSLKYLFWNGGQSELLFLDAKCDRSLYAT